MISDFKKGDALSASTVNTLLQRMMSCVRGANGILVRHSGNNLVISHNIPTTGGKRGGGTSGMTIETYAQFPAIPSSPTIIFMDVGTEHAIWSAGPGMTKWDPVHHYTDLTGQPGTPT